MIMVGQDDDQDKEARVLFGSRNKTLHVHHAHLLQKKTNTPCVNLTPYSTQYANIDGVPGVLFEAFCSRLSTTALRSLPL